MGNGFDQKIIAFPAGKSRIQAELGDRAIISGDAGRIDFIKVEIPIRPDFERDGFIFREFGVGMGFPKEDSPVLGGMESGVEIIARPPGRRAQGLALLSGGERALAAVALIFAFLKVSPPPFSILDEVDAMLDEVNIGRFVELLREQAQLNQFIVITHNRGTMKAANALYGITMGDDSVSRAFSKKLDDAD